jgi:uncharacterized LabA/DUF88 family protein
MKTSTFNIENFVKSNLRQANDYVSTLKHKESLKHSKRISKNSRLAFLITIERLNNNLNNEQTTGVYYSISEAKSLNLPKEGYYSPLVAVTQRWIDIILL